MNTYKTPCGCTFQRWSDNTEHVLKQCDSCEADFHAECHRSSADERAEARAQVNGVAA